MNYLKRKIAACALVLIMSISFLGAALFDDNRSIVGGGNPVSSDSLKLSENTSMALADTSPAFNENLATENEAQSGERWLVVTLQGESLAERGHGSDLKSYSESKKGQSEQQKLLDRQEALLTKMRKSGIPFQYKYGYTLLSNAVAIKCDTSYIGKIRKLDGVKSVSVSEYYYAPQDVAVSNNANVWGTGIYKVDDEILEKYNGSGMLLAVLDTGLDASHEAFQTDPSDKSKLVTKQDIQNRIFNGSSNGGVLSKNPSVTLDEVYYSEKVPYAYDYADNDADVYPSYSSHGTHVAGIMAGTPIVDENGEEEYIRDQDGNLILDKDGRPMTFTGVAPEAQLAIFKVFTDNEHSTKLGGAETVDILAALEDCVKLGVDVINMSLGSSAGFSTGDDEEMDRVYNNVRNAGISLVVAASNDYSSAYNGTYGTNLSTNPDSATVGSPSTFASSLSVASINGQQSKYIRVGTGENAKYLYFTEASDGNGNQKDFIKELKDKNPSLVNQDTGDITLDYVVVPGYGLAVNYSRIDVAGKVAVVRRGGEVTFEEKVRVAKQKGAIACVIYNNVSGVIRMSLGNLSDPVPTCSITMDAANGFLGNGNTGKFYVNESQKAGPFMSDFSSWGPTPDLRLKPEISAHGGEITSAVANGWDEYSGTSMASPNMAGAMSLILGYVSSELSSYIQSDKISDDRVSIANRLVMSTATIALDESGSPYSPRKQGAGLADIKKAMSTRAYIYVPGSDKTKLELGDDPKRTGSYTLVFNVKNFSNQTRTYTLGTKTMTETIASDGITVAERAYMLDHLSTITYTGKGVSGDKLTLAANADVQITVKIQLNDAAKKYIGANFTNGMYVEGFVTLTDTTGSDAVDLNIPWLGFYGDWYDGPMFDISEYELSDALQDDGIPDDEKPKAAMYATVPLGTYNDGKYIIPLGTYIYDLPASYRKIYSSSDKAAISVYDYEGHRTVYELYAIYAGLLRGAEYMSISIADASTGEIVFQKDNKNVRKAYTGGSSTARAAFVELEWSPADLNLENNKQYLFKMEGKLANLPEREYDASKYSYNKSFEFNFYVDTEAPEVVDYRVRYETYKDSNDKIRYQVFLDIDVYDNHYAQSVALCYADYSTMSLELLSSNLIPVYSSRNSVTTVSLDITDYYDSGIDLYVQVDDYALNSRAYRVSDFKPLEDAVRYPDSIDITSGIDAVNDEYSKEITLDINQAFKLETAVTPLTAASVNLYWHSFDESVVRVRDGEIFGVSQGDALVRVYAGKNEYASVFDTILVHVTDSVRNEPNITKLELGLIPNADRAQVNPTGTIVSVHPNEVIPLKVNAEPWYANVKPVIKWTSSSPTVASVGENTGIVRTLTEGSALIQGTLYVNGHPTLYTVSTTLVVGPDFVVQNGYLREYHGAGGKVIIPKSLNVYYIYEEAFMGNDNITELEISAPCTEIQPLAFANMKALKRVVLPDTVSFVYRTAFYNCRNLERIDLHSRSISFGENCFQGCTSLQYINNIQLLNNLKKEDVNILELEENTDFIRIPAHMTSIGNAAFADCTALTELDITELRVAGAMAFYRCTGLKKVILSRFTAISDDMFLNCTNLSELVYTDVSPEEIDVITYPNSVSPFGNCNISKITFGVGRVSYPVENVNGVQVIYGDEAKTRLIKVGQNATSFVVPASVETIAPNAFSGNSKLTSVTFAEGSRLREIGNYAFSGTAITSISLPASVRSIGVGAFSWCEALASADLSKTSIALLPARAFYAADLSGTISFNEALAAIGEECFSGTALTAVDLTVTSVTSIGNRAFASCTKLVNVQFGVITSMGRGVLEAGGNAALQSVSFADGSTALGTQTFSGQSALKTLVIPASLAEITEIGEGVFNRCAALTSLPFAPVTVGDRAFNGCTMLAQLNLSNLQRAGVRAFANCRALNIISLPALQSIADYAFYGCRKITALTLDAVQDIGAYAFFDTSLKSVSMDGVKTIGKFAFAYTSLAGDNGVLTLPASVESVGEGAFAGLRAITAFAGADRAKNLFVENGILYREVPNGFELLAYPAGKGGSVSIIEGTVRVAASAFENATAVTQVEIPYGFAAIGNKAFFNCGASKYIFGCLTAPVLEAQVLSASDFDQSDDMYKILNESGKIQTEKYYANFKNYVALVLFAGVDGVQGIKDLQLSLEYPENATGFGNRIYTAFFSTRTTSSVIADANARVAVEKIDAIPTAEEIRALIASDMQTWQNYKQLVRAAREAYNNVAGAQREFVQNADKLIRSEQAMREKAQMFGESVTRTRIYVGVNPDKTVYVRGEKFDKTGMVLVIVWSDGSIEEITEGFTVVNQDQPLSESNRTVKFTYEGLSTQLNITVNKPAVKSIAIATNPNKMVYKPGETLATPGLTLSVTYVDGITETVYSGYTVEAHSFVLGENIVIITYGGQSTTLKVQATEDGTIDEPNPPTPPGPEPSGDKKGCGGTMVGGSLALASVSVALACAFVCKKRKIR